MVDFKKQFSSFNNNELIAHMAERHGDNAAWHEFMNRFQKFIVVVIVKECQRLNYQKGTQKVDDLLHTVYLRLLQNNSKALKNFKGRFKNSIIPFLRLTALRVVLTDFKQSVKSDRHELLNSKDELINLQADLSARNGIDLYVLQDSLQHYLSIITEQRRNGQRDVHIFMLNVFAGLKSDEIAKKPEFEGVSAKRIANIVSEIKDEIRSNLALEGLA